MELPPGFRFHPTDEELITHYLSRKVAGNSLSPAVIGELDLNRCEPWDLPCKFLFPFFVHPTTRLWSKLGTISWSLFTYHTWNIFAANSKLGEEWYFFCVRDRKYPTGVRTNRATESGYWKATGKDKEIHRRKVTVGMKKTLVFYKGRAPKGEKTNWVMHEYRLEGKQPKEVCIYLSIYLSLWINVFARHLWSCLPPLTLSRMTGWCVEFSTDHVRVRRTWLWLRWGHGRKKRSALLLPLHRWTITTATKDRLYLMRRSTWPASPIPWRARRALRSCWRAPTTPLSSPTTTPHGPRSVHPRSHAGASCPSTKHHRTWWSCSANVFRRPGKN